MCQHIKVSYQGHCAECGYQLDLHLVHEEYHLVYQVYHKLSNYQKRTKELEAANYFLFFLDIDNTVLEAQATQVQTSLRSPNIQILRSFYQSCYDLMQYTTYADKIQRLSFQLESTVIEATFRPGIFKFVFEIQKNCKIVLSTLATRNYAEVIRSALDPCGTYIIEVVAREDYQVKSLAFGTRKSSLLRQRSLVFDDSSQAWENEKIAFIKSVCFGQFVGTQGFSNQSGLVMNSFDEKLHTQIAEKQLTSVSNIVRAMKKATATNCYDFIQQQQRTVFENCTFYVPLNLSQYQTTITGDHLIAAAYNGKQELIIQIINQFGGRVAVNSQIKGITHIVYTQQLISQYKQKLGIQTEPASEIPYTLLAYGEERLYAPAKGYYFVDSRFVFESCYMMKRQYEDRAHLSFLQHY